MFAATLLAMAAVGSTYQELDAQEQRLQLGQRRALHFRGYLHAAPVMEHVAGGGCFIGSGGLFLETFRLR